VIASELKSRAYEKVCTACRGELRLRDPCPVCGGTGVEEVRCRECYTWREVAYFMSAGRRVRCCYICRSGQRQGAERRPAAPLSRLLVKWTSCSRNTKTGPIPVSMTSAETCPTSCPWLGRGCYAEHHFTGMHWRRLSLGAGLPWDDFLERVRELPGGQLWRHNEAGDLPGEGDDVASDLLRDLCEAARRTRGFTYTHKPVLGTGSTALANRAALRRATLRGGLVINLSADGVEQADSLAELCLGPVVVTLPEHNPPKVVTPGGRRVVVCPAVSREGVSCATCRLCSVAARRCVVGFPAHGDMRRQMSERLGRQLKLF